MQNNNNNNNNNCEFTTLPLKPKLVATRSTPVSKERLPVFHKASELLPSSHPLSRSNALTFEHPIDQVLSMNKANLQTVEKQHKYAKQVLKRKYEDFLVDQETSPLSDSEDSSRNRGYIAYQQYKIQRKTQRIQELRNRLRAVGLTNLQLSEQLTVARVDICALRGANGSLYQHNRDLQQELRNSVASKHQMWAELANVCADDPYDNRSSDHEGEETPDLDVTLEELYCDEHITPSQETGAIEAPQAPPRTQITSEERNGVELTPLNTNPPDPNPIPEVWDRNPATYGHYHL